ncbi:MAG: SagB/ThcOx family dehydrogenase [Acidobacteria bacterium]|nr:SagB/ThcOx family dehydrogenase [Acidobacteriota bacterium]
MEQSDLGEEEVGRRVGWRAYHEATKHTVERLTAERRELDWAHMPAPFRHYEGVPLVDLPAEMGALGAEGERGGAEFLSRLFYYSAAVSATKITQSGTRYALRVNPSSGNLHPTEFHFATRGLGEWPDGLYHYRASSHEAERRAAGGHWVKAVLEAALAPWSREARVVLVLNSIFWREAWKYRDRAYRYCCLDVGHAWEALRRAALEMGCEAHAYGHFLDDKLRRVLNAEGDEQPMLIVALMGDGVSGQGVNAEAAWWGGEANILSAETVAYPQIQGVHRATSLSESIAPVPQAAPGEDWAGGVRLPGAEKGGERYATVARRRRSALDFQPHAEAMPLAVLSAILSGAVEGHGCDFEGDLSGMPSSRFVTLYLYVHSVAGLERGVYRYSPGTHSLRLMLAGDHRVAAAGLSLGQQLAGNCAVAFSLVADLERAAAAHGERAYRYVHFEAGAVGQRLYVGAERFGWQGTGIGAFYDDAVHHYLGLKPEQGQVVYHFALGRAVPDPRLSETSTAAS